MYKTMTRKEKINYLLKNNKKWILAILIYETIVGYLLMLYREDFFLFAFMIIFLLLIIVLIIKLFYPVNIFSKKVQITDGYINDRRGGHTSNGHPRLYGCAKTIDGSKTTKFKIIPFSFTSGMIPVKVIISKNKARDFIITEESYNYAKEHRGDVIIESSSVSTTIGIVIIIMMIIIVGMFLKYALETIFMSKISKDNISPEAVKMIDDIMTY